MCTVYSGVHILKFDCPLREVSWEAFRQNSLSLSWIYQSSYEKGPQTKLIFMSVDDPNFSLLDFLSRWWGSLRSVILTLVKSTFLVLLRLTRDDFVVLYESMKPQPLGFLEREPIVKKEE